MGGGAALGPMEGGAVGKGTVGAVVVDDPSGPAYTTAGQWDVVAGTGQKGAKP